MYQATRQDAAPTSDLRRSASPQAPARRSLRSPTSRGPQCLIAHGAARARLEACRFVAAASVFALSRTLVFRKSLGRGAYDLGSPHTSSVAGGVVKLPRGVASLHHESDITQIFTARAAQIARRHRASIRTAQDTSCFRNLCMRKIVESRWNCSRSPSSHRARHHIESTCMDIACSKT
jgi:hypothetical protein